MQTLLLLWNGDESAVPDGWFAEAARRTASGETIELSWSVGNRKSARAGDRVFLLRQGTERGLVGSGYLTDGEVWSGPHWSGDGEALYADVTWDRVLPTGDRLPLDRLAEEAPGKNWSFVLGGGQRLDTVVATRVEDAWQRHLWLVSDTGSGGKALRGERARSWVASNVPDLGPALEVLESAAAEVFGSRDLEVVVDTATTDPEGERTPYVTVVVPGAWTTRERREGRRRVYGLLCDWQDAERSAGRVAETWRLEVRLPPPTDWAQRIPAATAL